MYEGNPWKNWLWFKLGQSLSQLYILLATLFFGGANNGQKSKVKVQRNESTAEQSILRLYSSSEKAFAAAHLQKNSKLYHYNRPKEINSNMTPILSLKFCKYLFTLSIWHFSYCQWHWCLFCEISLVTRSKQDGFIHRLWLGFILCGSWERTCRRGSSFFPVIRGGGKGGGNHFAVESFSKSWWVSGGHFHIRERYLPSNFNKFNDSSTKREWV